MISILFLGQDLLDLLDLSSISPFPDGREKFQSRLKA